MWKVCAGAMEVRYAVRSPTWANYTTPTNGAPARSPWSDRGRALLSDVPCVPVMLKATFTCPTRSGDRYPPHS